MFDDSKFPSGNKYEITGNYSAKHISFVGCRRREYFLKRVALEAARARK